MYTSTNKKQLPHATHYIQPTHPQQPSVKSCDHLRMSSLHESTLTLHNRFNRFNRQLSQAYSFQMQEFTRPLPYSFSNSPVEGDEYKLFYVSKYVTLFLCAVANCIYVGHCKVGSNRRLILKSALNPMSLIVHKTFFFSSSPPHIQSHSYTYATYIHINFCCLMLNCWSLPHFYYYLYHVWNYKLPPHFIKLKRY